MTDKSATERLRETLDECGVEYETDDRNGLRETIWCGTAAFQLSPTAKMTMIVTPEQAIAATLGNSRAERTCDYKQAAEYWQRMYEETFAERTCHDTDANPWHFTCSACGYEQNGYELWNYCPNCGARVVGE